MKVVFVIDTLRQGGAERSAVILACSLAKAGHQVKFIIFDGMESVYSDELVEGGVDLLTLSWGGVFEDAFKLKRVFTLHKPDVVCSSLYKTVIRTRLASIFSCSEAVFLDSLVNLDYSWLPSDIGFVRYLKQAARKNLDRLLYWIARPKLHSVSKAVSDHFGKIYGIGPDQIYHVGRGRSCPNTITSDKRMGIRRNVFKCSEEDFVCINVGRQEYQKNQAALVSAFKNLKGKNFKLVIVGREGEETAKINQAISKNDLFKEVEILGFRHDVTDLLQASDIFLFPSFIEGAAGAVIEAMAASLPVIASDIPPHRELLSNKDGVLLVKSVEEIPLLISELSKDSPSLKKMGEVNFSIFQSEFCDDIIVYKFEKLLRSLYDENPRVRV